MGQTKSFYDIISEYIIEVPIIQREYAQGRNTEKVKAIRKRLVNDLVSSITNNTEIHLGFVYGKIQGRENLARKIQNREAVSSILDAVKFYASNLELRINANIEEAESDCDAQSMLKFIPLDGQQRLTTLYLLYWFLYFKGATSQNREWLNHFKYSNRKSALAFCKELVNGNNIDIIRGKKRKNKEANIKEIISNCSFYLKKWDKDATVSGMLEMLFSIERAFDSSFDFSKIEIEKLPFKFDFMDLDSLNQTDELYVKMNARGKHLSDYEHFKSWLQEKYKDNPDTDWLKSFWIKLDTTWLNYVWRNIDADFNGLDNFYYNYLKNLALMYCLANNQTIPFEQFRNAYSLIRNTEVYDAQKVNYISLENYYIKWENDGKEEDFFIFNIDTLKFIERTFDSLIYLEQSDNDEKLDLEEIICKPFIENTPAELFLKRNLFTPTLWHSVFYYSFIVFINDREKEDYTVNGLREWLRFTRNIIYNTYIQRPEDFNSALKQLNNLANYKFKINEAVLNEDIRNVFFETKQFEEEKIKIGLFNIMGWKEPIVRLENHLYLYGQIRFVLDFSKDQTGDYSLENFEKYSFAVSELYKEEIRCADEKILERFLLCEDDYLPQYKSGHIFCASSLGNLRVKNENWRLFFKGNKIYCLKNAIDKLGDGKVTPTLLLNFINNYISTCDLGYSNWRNLFLKYPLAIGYCKESTIRRISDNDIRLLKGFSIIAYHAELRTYCFYLENKNSDSTAENRIAPVEYFPFTKFWFFEDKNTDGSPGVHLEGFIYNKKEYKIDIRYSKVKDEFEMCFFNKAEDLESREIEIDLGRLNFSFDDNYKHYFKSVGFNEIGNEVKDICSELKAISL